MKQKAPFCGILLLILASCSPPKMEDVVARVKEDPILVKDVVQSFYRERSKFEDGVEKNSKKFLEVKKHLLDDLVQKKILESEAQQQGIQVSPEELEAEVKKYKSRYNEREFQKILEERKIDYNNWREIKRVNLLTDKLVHQKLFADIAVPEESLKAYYQEHTEEFTRPETVRIRQILTDTKEKADALYTRLKAGENFARLAHDYSIAPDRNLGGDLGFVAKGHFPKEFDACFDLKIGELSPIISSLYGFHIFKLTDKKPEERLSFEQVKGQINGWLSDQLREEAFKKYYEELRKKYPVEVKEWVLKKIEI